MGALPEVEKTKPKRWLWLERLIWILIFGGLLLVVLGIATGDDSVAWGWSLGSIGAVATAAGCVLIYIRSRLPE
jgi:hypothetical protein